MLCHATNGAAAATDTATTNTSSEPNTTNANTNTANTNTANTNTNGTRGRSGTNYILEVCVPSMLVDTSGCLISKDKPILGIHMDLTAPQDRSGTRDWTSRRRFRAAKATVAK